MYINTQEELNALCRDATVSKLVGVDLEFIPENTFYPVLALVQLAVNDRFVLLDPLGPLDLSPLDQLVLNPDVCKVVHAGFQDMGIFYHRTGQVPRNVFDTQLAAAFVGMGHQVSYGQMVQGLFDVSLEKGESYTNWLQRPLTANQEKYAIDDVRYLLLAHEKIVGDLVKLGRLEWVLQELLPYEQSGFYEIDPEDAHIKVKKRSSLRDRDFAVLRKLAGWRELEARRRDKPRRKVLSDEAIVEIARRRPTTAKKLKEIRGLYGPDVRAYGDAIIQRVHEGANTEVLPKNVGKARLTPKEEILADFLIFCLRAFCTTENICAANVGTRSDVENIVRQHLGENQQLVPGDHRLLTGWRKEAVGDKLLLCLEGRMGVRLNPDSAELVFD